MCQYRNKVVSKESYWSDFFTFKAWSEDDNILEREFPIRG